MKQVRFTDPAGSTRTGRWTDDGIEFGDRTYDPDEVDILPPVEPTKFVCLGANYIEHIKEGGGEPPKRPLLFLKGPNAVAGHGDTVTIPDVDVDEELLPDDWGIDLGEGRIDYEAELGVVIGQQCKDVDAEDAEDVIAGYTCANDISNRDDQAAETNWIRGKAFDNASPIGPVLATPEHVDPDPRIRLYQNGELKQDSEEDEMVFSVAEAIEAITEFVTLEEGDVVMMGTTHGVGPLEDGDTIEIEIEGIGTLEHDVRTE
ncbi:fumarylacetoacetate hydrolase family protein [Halovenus marina]|uniref:fumarylacetoacetate hydrolase family protein n=1 Tax=Halovenus marina TaxID=3396621 RepID=UPI003F54992A